MNPADFTVLETITKLQGVEFDLKEAFRKLATSQFGGNPGRGFCELIQNAIDSYPSTVPLREKKIAIRTSDLGWHRQARFLGQNWQVRHGLLCCV